MVETSIPVYGPHVREWVSMLEGWKDALQSKGLDAMIEAADERPPRLPTVKKDTPGRKEAKKRIDDWKESIKKRFRETYCALSEEALRQQVREMCEQFPIYHDLLNWR